MNQLLDFAIRCQSYDVSGLEEREGSHEDECPWHWKRRLLFFEVVDEKAEDAGGDDRGEELEQTKGVKRQWWVWGGFGGDLRPSQI